MSPAVTALTHRCPPGLGSPRPASGGPRWAPTPRGRACPGEGAVAGGGLGILAERSPSPNPRGPWRGGTGRAAPWLAVLSPTCPPQQRHRQAQAGTPKGQLGGPGGGGRLLGPRGGSHESWALPRAFLHSLHLRVEFGDGEGPLCAPEMCLRAVVLGTFKALRIRRKPQLGHTGAGSAPGWAVLCPPCPARGRGASCSGPPAGGRGSLGEGVSAQAVLHAHLVVQLLQLRGQGDAQLSQVQGKCFKGIFQF